MIGQVINALVTPFNENGEIDYEEVRRLLQIGKENCNDAFVVGSTTGEGTSLSLEEKRKLYIFCKEKISKYIIDNCTQISKCTVHFEECLDYIITENNKKEIHIMCSSLRLDSVVAQLSHCSRSEALKKIHAGFVKVNDVVLEQNLQLCNNDFVSIRKTGRFQFKEVVSTTKKGRLVLNFDQYIVGAVAQDVLPPANIPIEPKTYPFHSDI